MRNGEKAGRSNVCNIWRIKMTSGGEMGDVIYAVMYVAHNVMICNIL
jgi:hypothetical protein